MALAPLHLWLLCSLWGSFPNPWALQVHHLCIENEHHFSLLLPVAATHLSSQFWWLVDEHGSWQGGLISTFNCLLLLYQNVALYWSMKFLNVPYSVLKTFFLTLLPNVMDMTHMIWYLFASFFFPLFKEWTRLIACFLQKKEKKGRKMTFIGCKE